MKRLVYAVLLVAALSGCSIRYESAAQKQATLDRRQQVANSAATIWEAADSLEKLLNDSITFQALPAATGILQVVRATKANALAIIRSQGVLYPPAGLTELK